MFPDARKERYILTLDIGTSSIKGAILSTMGKLVSLARKSFTDSGLNGYGSFSAHAWSGALAEVMAGLWIPDDLLAVCVSGNGPTLVPLSKEGVPLYSVLLWVDERNNRISNLPSFYLPKAAWLSEHEPEVYEKTAVFLGCPEYINYLLTGEFATILPHSGFQQYIWDKSQISSYGLDDDRFPEFVHMGSVVGRVAAKAGERYGVPKGVPVYAGGPDFFMALLGTAAVEPGRVCDRAGTSEGVNLCIDSDYKVDGLRTLPHVIQGFYNLAAIEPFSGRFFEWFRGISGQEGKDYERMFKEISEKELSSKPRFFPSIGKKGLWDFSGGIFSGLSVEHSTADMGRAVVEAIGYCVKSGIKKMGDSGFPFTQLRASGGQAKNPIWNQMKADITGQEILVPEICDSELTGCLCCALYGEGYDSSVKEASERVVRFPKTYQPDRTRFEQYEESYHRYQQTYSAIIRAVSQQNT
ncbi:MAG: xylulokinase [Spirochaetia bacterium]